MLDDKITMNMYNQLNEVLSQNSSDDYFYDDEFMYIQELMNKFVEKDWVLLKKEVKSKNIEWQRKLAYCIDNNNDINELEVLLILSTTDDKELFSMCIDSFRSFLTDNEFKKIIVTDDNLINKFYKMRDSSIGIYLAIYEDFLKLRRIF